MLRKRVLVAIGLLLVAAVLTSCVVATTPSLLPWTKIEDIVYTGFKVGIGTAYPKATLHIKGDTIVEGTLYANKIVAKQFGSTNYTSLLSNYYTKTEVDTFILGNYSNLRSWILANYYDKTTIDSWNPIKNYTLEQNLDAAGHSIVNVGTLEAENIKLKSVPPNEALDNVLVIDLASGSVYYRPLKRGGLALAKRIVLGGTAVTETITLEPSDLGLLIIGRTKSTGIGTFYVRAILNDDTGTVYRTHRDIIDYRTNATIRDRERLNYALLAMDELKSRGLGAGLTVTIHNPNEYALTDYQVRIELPFTPSQYIRVVDEDGNDLPFCYEQPSKECEREPVTNVIWVKVPFIPANGDTKIYIILATTNYATSGKQVFIVYDNFDDGLDPDIWVDPRTLNEKTDYYDDTLDDYAIAFNGDANNRVMPHTKFPIQREHGIIIEARLRKIETCSDHFIYISPSSTATWSWGTTSAVIRFCWNCNNKFIYGQSTYTSAARADYDYYDIRITILLGQVKFYDEKTLNPSDNNTISLDDPNFDQFYIYIGADEDSTSYWSPWFWIRVRKYADIEPTVEISVTPDIDVKIKNPNNYELKDYQVRVNLNTLLPAPTNITVTLPNLTSVAFCYEQPNGECTAYPPSRTIWVKVPYIPANGETELYIFVGTNGAVNGSEVFDFYDDFNGTLDPGKWVWEEGKVSVASGILQVRGADSNDVVMVSQKMFNFNKGSIGLAVEWRMRYVEQDESWSPGWDVFLPHQDVTKNDASDTIGNYFLFTPYALDNSHGAIYRHESTTWTQVAYEAGTHGDGEWHIYTGAIYGNFTLKLFEDGREICSYTETEWTYLTGYLALREGNHDVDWVRVRKLADKEPIVEVQTYREYIIHMVFKAEIWRDTGMVASEFAGTNYEGRIVTLYLGRIPVENVTIQVPDGMYGIILVYRILGQG